jgi:hypothetical protein
MDAIQARRSVRSYVLQRDRASVTKLLSAARATVRLGRDG